MSNYALDPKHISVTAASMISGGTGTWTQSLAAAPRSVQQVVKTAAPESATLFIPIGNLNTPQKKYGIAPIGVDILVNIATAALTGPPVVQLRRAVEATAANIATSVLLDTSVTTGATAGTLTRSDGLALTAVSTTDITLRARFTSAATQGPPVYVSEQTDPLVEQGLTLYNVLLTLPTAGTTVVTVLGARFIYMDVNG